MINCLLQNECYGYNHISKIDKLDLIPGFVAEVAAVGVDGAAEDEFAALYC